MPHEELELETPRNDEEWEAERWQCEHCAAEHYDDVECEQVDGSDWCPGCVEDDSIICERCESRSNAEDSITVDRGYESSQIWCESCADGWSSTCERCSTTVDHEYCETVDGETWCYDCKNDYSSFCEGCEEYTHMDNVRRINDDCYVCESCFESYYFCCEGCEENFHNDDDYGEDGNYCEDCAREQEPEGIGPHDATSRMVLVFHYTLSQKLSHGRIEHAHNVRKGLYFGVETEVELSRDSRRYFDVGTVARDFLEENDNDFFYTMSDSTINEGFEIATHPFTFEWAQDHKEWWNPLFDLRESCRAYDEKTVGMHVHMSRNGFKPVQLLKFTRFFFENPELLARISRRHPQKTKALLEWSGDSMAYRARGNVGGSRLALAFNENNTIECRLFRSTLSPRGYWANIEFLKALFDFTAEVSMADISPEKFFGWVRSRPQTFSTFLEVFDRRVPSKSRA